MKTDPYQWFFPIGLVMGCLGTGIWVVNWRPGLAWYPGPIHADLMTGGFFLVTAVGFLMTAIPRFTGTDGARLWEKMVMAVPASVALTSAYSHHRIVFHASGLAMALMLLAFAARRFYRAQLQAPPSFVLVGLGIVSAVVSNLLMFSHDIRPLPLPLLQFARWLYIYGTSFFFILGVGLKLLPFLMGMTPENPPWRILLWPRSKTVLAVMLWVAVWMVILGFAGMTVFPALAVQAAHLYFIGGISLLIFSVATRVTLAHGGHGLAMERRSWLLATVLVLIVISAFTRLTALWFSGLYVSHLAYAALCWLAAAICWGLGVLPKILCRKSAG